MSGVGAAAYSPRCSGRLRERNWLGTADIRHGRLQVEIVEQYTPEQRFRLLVKPGLTGPMQVYGRGALRFDERLAVERDYIENVSIGRDLRILALTIVPVLRRRGAY